MPIPLQAELLARSASYDRNLAARAGDRVRILIVTKPGHPQSAHVASQMQRALGSLRGIGSLGIETGTHELADPAALATACRAGRISIVYVTPGLDGEIEAIARALEAANVLSVAALPQYVERGMVLGFDLMSGKPRLLVHLPRAKQQGVAFSGPFLKVARVYQ